MVDKTDVNYGSARYSYAPYAGYANPLGAASQQLLGVPFLVGNDRYQVIVCADSGDAQTVPQYRYWYAGGVPYGSVINEDSDHPVFHTADEDGNPVIASVEFPFTTIKTASEAQVDFLYVEFTPQPLVVDPSNPDYDIGFSARVEGYGIPSFSRAATVGTSGVTSSDVTTVTITLGDQSDDPWPNTRTVQVPIRFETRVRAFRPIISNMFLCEINRVTCMGKQLPARNV